MRLAILITVVICLLAVTLARGQEVVIQVDPPRCLPLRGNAALTANLITDEESQEVAGLRLYFRRFNPLGSFYYVEMQPLRADVFSAIFPMPEDRVPAPVSSEWWDAVSRRLWLAGNDRTWLVSWLAVLDFEPVEYFVAAHDAEGERIARTPVDILEVKNVSRCPVSLSEQERQWAQTLSLGETMDLQTGRPPFHWTCGGVVERISPDGGRSQDRSCAD